jgi:two-component system, LytTR family, sensor kinase
MQQRQFEIGEDQLLRVKSVKSLFWVLHSLGWASYVLIFAFDNILFYQNKAINNGVHILVPLFFSGLIAWLCTLPLRHLYRRCWNLSPLNLALTIITASIVVAMVWTPIKNIVMWQLANDYDVYGWLIGESEDKYSRLALFSSVSYSFFIVMVWSSLYFGINYHFRLVREKEQHLQAIRLSHNAQIKMLRYQINPHFLFNTLNAISTLVLKGNKEKANGMLTRLSTFLRFSLDNDPEQKIRLYEELKALMLYLEIEKTRFDDRLSVRFNVEPRAESLLVPSLLLQPLVENSIKYAIARMVSGGRIEITAKCQNNLLHLEVADNGPNNQILSEADNDRQYAEPERKGLGLSNIRERLIVLYPQRHYFEVIDRPTKGFKVIIEIPIEEG